VDLFLVHQPWEKDKETYEALERWVKSWKIRSVWISNYYSKESFDEMVKNMDIKPAVLQNENHIYYQNIELKDYIKKYWTVLESWYPLWGRWHTEESFSHPIIQKLAEKYKKSSAQIILRWQIQDWYIAIPWSSNPEHIKENYSIFDFELTEQEMKLIRMINENKRYENR
jgi:diketogulonate reductase-like aldo/keto reductase